MRRDGDGAAYGPADFQRDTHVSRETLARLERFAGLLQKWSRAINLVGRSTLPEMWRRHMLDSAQLIDLLPPAPQGRPRRIVDLGSGAGFPGLVLAILGAGEVHLIESDQRKAVFLREVIRETGVEATVHPVRIESAPAIAADVVTARALAALPELLQYAAKFLPSGGVCVFPKGKGVGKELTAARKAWKMAVERFPSRSDPGGTILRIEVRRCDSTNP